MKKEYEYNTSDDYQIESPICDINVINYHMGISKNPCTTHPKSSIIEI